MRSRRALVIAFCGACALGAAARGPVPGAQLLAAAVATAVAVAVAAPLAVALGRQSFEGRALALTVLVLSSATSPGLLNVGDASLAARFTSGLALAVPVATWIVYLVARSLPADLEDLAALDGASGLRIWLSALRPGLLIATPLVFFFCAFDLAIR